MSRIYNIDQINEMIQEGVGQQDWEAIAGSCMAIENGDIEVTQ